MTIDHNEGGKIVGWQACWLKSTLRKTNHYSISTTHTYTHMHTFLQDSIELATFDTDNVEEFKRRLVPFGGWNLIKVSQ